MNRCERLLSTGMLSLGIGILVGVGASADPNPDGNTGEYQLDPCDQFDVNGQCSPFGTAGTLGDGSSVRADSSVVTGSYDIVQPVNGVVYFDVSGTTATIPYSAIDIAFTVTVEGFGFVVTDITSRIDGAVGNVVGDDIQWTGSETFVSNGTIDCQLSFGLCNVAGYADGINVFVEGCNTSFDNPNDPSPVWCGSTNPPTPDPTPITLSDFAFTVDGLNLYNTGEFDISKSYETVHNFLALEATYLPEPGMALMLAPGLLLLFALDRRRAHVAR